MKDERRKRILEAIVRDYVSTSEPVSSKALAKRYDLGVSPATIRIDMAALEEEGFITQPHTSAGRVPTDTGYRAFVDSLSTITPLSASQRKAIEEFLNGANDLDEIASRAVKILAHLTHHVAVLQYPSLSRVSLRHLELIAAGSHHMIAVIITDAGRVEQRTVEVEAEVNEEALTRLGSHITRTCKNKPLEYCVTEAQAYAHARGVSGTDNAHAHNQSSLSQCAYALAQMFSDILQEDAEERIVMAGTANLSRHAPDFARSISPVLDTLEEHMTLLRLLAHMQSDVDVSIGHENEHDGLQEASVIASTYRKENTNVARVGIVGPTRMDYPRSIAAVEAVARYLSQILSNGS